LSQSDPTDNALAAIASILDQPESHREPEKVAVEEPPAPPPAIEAAGYSKLGPGPMAAIRFKWTVREDDGAYYVDETIGENSTPLVTGPMTNTPKPMPENATPATRPRRSWNQRESSRPIGTQPSATRPSAPSTPV